MTLDRRRLVRRHNPVLTTPHPTNVLTLGNGDLALTVDISGLQTEPDLHRLVPDPRRVVGDGITGLPEQRPRRFDPDDFQIPLRTQSTWGWYETRTTRELRLDDTLTTYETSRGPVPYHDRMGIQRAGDPIAEEFTAGAWYHFNPRRSHLGRLALVRPGGLALAGVHELRDPRTELDLWTGRVASRYVLENEPVSVTTTVAPDAHHIAVRIESTLLRKGWGIAWVFDDQPDDLAPFELPVEQRTTWTVLSRRELVARRSLESCDYTARMTTTGVIDVAASASSMVATTDDDVLEVVVGLHPGHEEADDVLPSFAETRASAARWWHRYWSEGAMVSLEGSTDDRAPELERRIVMSQYLTAVNCAGACPPAETGLTYNTWSGKFHLEMHWWHAAHFPLWRRGQLLERSLGWYHGALEAATATARAQGYRGARWPKQTDLSGRESPSNIGVFLIWQQPHLVYLLELLWSEGRELEFLREHYTLIEATAEFMADFVEERDGAFTLPPPLVPAQESYLVDRERISDPTFELAYWAWALQVANDWRERLGHDRRADWDQVARGMNRPAIMADGTYAAVADPPYLVRKDHPSMLMALGWLPDTGLVDESIMAATLDAVWARWDLQSSWGWDYPVMAMTAARLGDLTRAFDALLLPSPKNEYLPNGHNPQMPGFLTLYLPANGGLLAAVAHIAAAIDDGAEVAPGWVFTAEEMDVLARARHRTAAAR